MEKQQIENLNLTQSIFMHFPEKRKVNRIEKNTLKLQVNFHITDKFKTFPQDFPEMRKYFWRWKLNERLTDRKLQKPPLNRCGLIVAIDPNKFNQIVFPFSVISFECKGKSSYQRVKWVSWWVMKPPSDINNKHEKGLEIIDCTMNLFQLTHQ